MQARATRRSGTSALRSGVTTVCERQRVGYECRRQGSNTIAVSGQRPLEVMAETEHKPKNSPSMTAPPPEAWSGAQRFRARVRAPIEAFLHIQAASGLLLLAMAVIALIWANSPWHHSYHHLFHETEIGFAFGDLAFKRPIHFWINDGLMAIFFFVVGLEIKREMMEGELSELKRASLPIAAAIGGMVVPALLYYSMNPSGEAAAGWGVPMATDIAFAVGILSLLGPRVPAALRILLLALAIIDDIGAILVIAIFYTNELHYDGLAFVGAGSVVVLLMQRVGIRLATLYVVPALVIWGGMYRLGVHPTIAGVMLGLATPHKSWFGKEGFLAEVQYALDDFQNKMGRSDSDEHELMHPLNRMEVARREAFSPLARLQMGLHGYVAYLIMPVFALANAGVHVGGMNTSDAQAMNVGMGVALGLVIGKPLGILGASFIAVKLGLSSLPRGVGFKGVFIVGCVGGIGFTMAIFIAELAFPGSSFLGVGKLAILIGSALIAVVGLLAGRVMLPKELPDDIADIGVHEAERSTEF